MLSKIKSPGFFTRMRPPKGRWFILTLILLAAIAGGAYYYQYHPQSVQITTTKSQLQTAVARQGNIVIYASGTGTLASQSEATFGFKASGQVAKVNVKVGDVVEAGQVLAELDNTESQIAYQQAKRTLEELTSASAIATAQEAVATAAYNVATTREDLQYLISPAVQIWQERLAEDEEALATAQAEATANPSEEANKKVQDARDVVTLDRYYLEEANKNLYTYLLDNFSEKQTNPRTGKERIVWERDEETGKRYANIYPPTESEIAVAQATYDLAKATLTEAKIYVTALSGGEIPEGYTSPSLVALENAKTNLQAAQDELQNNQLIAPIAGTIMSLDLNVGDYVGSGSTVVSISDMKKPSLEIYLDESDWGNVGVGYEAEVTFDILPDDTYQGKVIQVYPGLYTENNTSVVRAIVKLDDAVGSLDLPLGSTASVNVIGGRAENAVLIPIEALHKAGNQYAVFVMENGELRLRIVEVGIQDLQYAEIISGLKVGDIVSTGITETK